MNEVFLMGKIISPVEFGFMVESKHYAMSRFRIETLDGQIIEIRAYDKVADFVYSKIKVGDSIFVYGSLNMGFVLIRSISKLVNGDVDF